MTHQIIDFDSLDALVTAASAPSSWATRDSREGEFSFTGTRSFDQACEFARHGWQDGLSRMQCALDAVKASNTASGPAPGFLLDVAGAYPIAALAAAGDAFCMMAPTQQIKWLSTSALYSWFSNMGAEIEYGRRNRITFISVDQIDGLCWPNEFHIRMKGIKDALLADAASR